MTDREKIEQIVHDLDSLCQSVLKAGKESDYPVNLIRLGEYSGLDHALQCLKSAFELGEFDDNNG